MKIGILGKIDENFSTSGGKPKKACSTAFSGSAESFSMVVSVFTSHGMNLVVRSEFKSRTRGSC